MATFFSNANDIDKRGWRYKEFVSNKTDSYIGGNVWVKGLGRSVSVDVVRVPHNDQKSWQRATSIRRDPCDCRFYEVFLSDEQDINCSLENLQYFFIRADRAIADREQMHGAQSQDEEKHQMPELGLIVHVRRDDLFRLQVFLAMQTYGKQKYNLLYVADERSNNSDDMRCHTIDPVAIRERAERWQERERKRSKNQGLESIEEKPFRNSLVIKSMMPLLHVVAHDQPKISGDIPISLLFSYEKGIGESGRYMKLSDNDISESCEITRKTQDIYWWESLQDCCKALLNQTFKHVEGTHEYQLSSKQKEIIRQQLKEYILCKRDHMSFLAEMCWYFHLQELMEEKYLLNLEERTLDKEMLKRSCQDALAYSDGLQQILENSCQHSAQKSAYLTLRLHWVDRNCTDLQLPQVSEYRRRIIKRYKSMWSDGWDLDRSVKFYIEIGVVDDASTGKTGRTGILQHYRQQILARQNSTELELPNELRKIFCDNIPIESDDIIHHYGIQAMVDTVARNHGDFLVSSPYSDHTEVVLCRPGKSPKQRNLFPEGEDIEFGPQDTTEYHILFPLGMDEVNDFEQEKNKWKDILEIDCLKNPQANNIKTQAYKLPGTVTHLLFCENFLTQSQKNENVAGVICFLRGEMSKIIHPENTIMLFDVQELDDLQLEVFTKALFRIILDNPSKRLLFALFFKDYSQQEVLIRLIAIFYRRCQNNGQIEPKRTQIALCSQSARDHLPEVNMILNLKDWYSLGESAYCYTYSNIESSRKVYDQIRYFFPVHRSRKDALSKTSRDTDSSVFPFDLYLDEKIGIEEKMWEKSAQGIPPSSCCWFLRRMHMLLEQNLQQKELGVKIPDIHAYLPTNIHIGSFYEAEQLFRNVSYVCRFAYLLALRLLKNGFQVEQKALIVCYEAYSSLLVQYLAHYLNQSQQNETLANETDDTKKMVRFAIVYREKRNHSRLLLPPDMDRQSENSMYFEHWKFITLCPIATTLSTIHALHECIRKKTGIPLKADNTHDLTMILVAEKQPHLQKKYWDFQASDRKTNVVNLHDQFGKGIWKVHYFISVYAEWHNPRSCVENIDAQTLVYADATSTELNMIFPMKQQVGNYKGIVKNRDDWEMIHNHDVCSMIPYDMRKENSKRLELLQGCVYYSHIYRGSNHYAYYIDFPQYFEALLRDPNKAYEKWLTELIKSSPNNKAFNVIVAPLRNGISPLLKDLVDHVFHNSIHILQLDLHNVRRMDIRTKYHYIAQECADVIRNDPNMHIHVYYVDDSLVTADTLQRGYNLINMLLSDCLDRNEISSRVAMFKEVYVLVNRSSKDTVQSFVQDPRTEFHAFVHLANPHFNTRNNECPTCKQVEKYKLLTMRSTTNRFAQEYQRLVEKHDLRTVPEYIHWQKNQLWTNPSAFLRLRQWIYNQGAALFHSELKDAFEMVKGELFELQKQFFDDFVKKYREDWREIQDKDTLVAALAEQNALYDSEKLGQQRILRQTFLLELENMSLPDELRRDNKKRNAFEEVWIRGVLADTAHRRLMSTHDAFSNLWLEKEPENRGQMREMILTHLYSTLTAANPVQNWELLNSGLKVISRDVLSRHHMVREAMFLILKDAAEVMIGNTPDDADSLLELFCVAGDDASIPTLIAPVDMGIDPLLRYQMFYSIMRRLADMQSNYPIRIMRSGQIPQKLETLTKVFFQIQKDSTRMCNRWFHCTIPSYQNMIFSYEKCIKLSTMAEDDEHKNILIQDEYLDRPVNS